MKFLERTVIENNIITYNLKAEYNDPPTSEEEQEIETLHDYIRKVKFTDINFTANIDMSTGMPIAVADSAVTVDDGDTDDTADGGLVRVSVGAVTPREYVVDDELDIEFSIDVSRIFDGEVNDTLTSKILVGQAKIAVFAFRVKEKISEILQQMRDEDNDFEGVNETVL
ncbi:MAG: hypothetical protein NC299_16700 [Lachnospiraceae bacterium]|nr:hypothetical protein [Lachnospiraceae bacterium]